MKKTGLLNLLKQAKVQSELEEFDDTRFLRVLILLVDYINDSDIKKAVDEVVM